MIEDRYEIDGCTVSRIGAGEKETWVAIIEEVGGALRFHLNLAIERA